MRRNLRRNVLMRQGKRGVLLLALIFITFVGVTLLRSPDRAYAAHDLTQMCGTCHSIKGGNVWAGSRSIWSGKAIGMTSYSRPITCDFCHTSYGQLFTSSSESHHPVQVISGNTMVSDYDYGTTIMCANCHGGDTYNPGTGNLSPDVAPSHYNDTTGNTATDGYPNHDVASPDNQVNPGDPPHLVAAYNNIPSSTPLTDYALCFTCHDGSTNTSRQVDVKTAYSKGGHYYKYGTPTGGNNGDAMPCGDCHSPHASTGNARLYVSPRGTTGLTYLDPANPTGPEIRAICTDCHDDYGTPTNGTPLVRGVEPPARPTNVSDHADTSTRACTDCHNPHNPPAGGPDCLTCHTPGGGAGTYDYIDTLFKGVGPDGDTKPAVWSQHGGFTGSSANFVYQSPYDKANNDCQKCHGERHTLTDPLIDPDPNDTYVFTYDANLTDINDFCLSCHDGGATAPTSSTDVQIGGQTPPDVSQNWTTGGHGNTGTYTNDSGYAGAALRCIDCHVVHGSDMLKLLPYTQVQSTPETHAPTTVGNVQTNNIDYTDYSNPSSGLGFGTAGDQKAAGGTTIGFCDACHRDSATTDDTLNKAHTHEGDTTDTNQTSPSQMNFSKDCAECHNPHGTTNDYMVRTTINGRSVVFTAQTGTNSFDDNADTSGNVGDLCTVCHESPSENTTLNVDHNYFTSTANPDHNEGADCTACHPHGDPANAAKFGFAQAACNSCHGRSTDSSGMPYYNDGATYHTDAVVKIASRSAYPDDAHSVHVEFLVNKLGYARGNTCYVCHQGGGAQESGGHPGNPTNTSFKSGATPDPTYVQVSVDPAFWNNVGTGPVYSGTVGQAADGTNGWKTCSNITCHYGESPSWANKIQALPGTLTVDTPDNLPAAGTFASGSTNNLVDKIRLAASGGDVTVSGIKVKQIGTAQDTSDIAAVTFWLDDGDGTFNTSTDTNLGSGTYNGTDQTYAVSVNIGVADGTSKTVFVAVDIASGATNGTTVQTQVNDGYITASFGTVNTITSFSSNQFTIQAPGTLTVTTPDNLPAAGNILAGSTGNVVDRIALTASGGIVTVDSIKVKQVGTAVDTTDIAAVQFWQDSNKDGTPDTQLGGNATYNSTDNTYTVSGLNFTVADGTTEWVLVVVNVASGATDGNTVQTQVNDGYVTASSGTVNTITSFSSNTFTIVVDTLQSVVITDTQGSSTPVSGTSLGTGQTHQFYATAVYSVSGNVDVTNSATWTLTQNQSGGSVSAGLYTAGSTAGTDIVQATYGGLSDTTDVTVTSGPIEGDGYYIFGSWEIRTSTDLSSPPATTSMQFNPGDIVRIWVNDPTGDYSNKGFKINDAQNGNNTVYQGGPSGGDANGQWYDWDTTGRSGCYSIEVKNSANNPKALLQVQIGTSEVGCVRLFSDPGYSIPANAFKSGSVIYVQGTLSQSDSLKAGQEIKEVGNNMNTKVTPQATVDQDNSTVLRAHFTFDPAAAGIADGDWGYIKFESNGKIIKGGVMVKYDSVSGVAPPRLTGQTTAIACDTCHQFGPRDDSLDANGHPTTGTNTQEYTYSSTGDHIKHGAGDPQNWTSPSPVPGDESSLSTPCSYCHGDISGYTTNHMNGTVDLASGSIGGPGDNGTWDPVTRTCSNVDCHGNQQTPEWGVGTINCSGCHSGTEPASKPVETPGDGPNAINFTEYTTQGHGNSTTFPGSGNTGPGFSEGAGCYNCHDQNAQHAPTKSSTDPYRLGAYATNVNGLCLSCHTTMQPHAESITGAGSHDWPPTGTTDYDYKCVDCHDPHGDSNYYMIRSAINNPTSASDTTMGSNTYGTPNDTTLSSVTFTDLTGFATNSYAWNGADGICEVCHNQTNHYQRNDVNNTGHFTTRCTNCHNHDQGFKGSGDCQLCHSTTQGPRRAITPEFGLASHHSAAVNSSTVTKNTCVQCHAEGNADGTINSTYHNNGTSSPYPIDLKVYGTYPTVSTVVSITDIASATQTELLNLNQHCLSCHNDTNSSITPFSGDGDTNTPVAKSWDGNSVDSKYSNTGTTPFGKFDSTQYNVLPWDKVDKAYSPHGNVAANRGGYAVSTGWTDRGGAGGITSTGTGTRTGVTNVACLDCHNSHGSNVTNIWWIGDTNTTTTGGLIKDLVSIGEGTYQPQAGTGYPAESDLCWDCHFGDDNTAPKTYADFGIQAKIGYYHENSTGGPTRWSGTLSWVSTFSFKNANIMSDHFSTVSESTPRTTILWNVNDMSCGACHDPHGVSSNQTNAQFMVPALKGTWVTSPYKEDRPPRIDNPGASTTMFNQNDSGANTWKDKYAGYPAPRANPEFKTTIWANSLNYNVPTASGGGMGLTKYVWGSGYSTSSTRLGWDGYFIDENTFGTNGNYWKQGNVVVYRMSDANPSITDPTVFGGLCLVCHPRANIESLTSPIPNPGVAGWASSTLPHNTVMGWAGQNSNIFHRGVSVTKIWYANPPTMHGMDHYSYSGTGWVGNDYGPSGPRGYVQWVKGAHTYGTTDSTTSNPDPSNAHQYMWGPNPSTQGANAQGNTGSDGVETAYHQFPCSKCHSPHVARLPRLLRTNCLDNDGTNTINWGGGSIYVNSNGVTLYGNMFRNVACHSTFIGWHTNSPTLNPTPGGWNGVTPW